MQCDNKKCQIMVKKHCKCGWARCHERRGWNASLCCPSGYDLVCCTLDTLDITTGNIQQLEFEENLIANHGQDGHRLPVIKEMDKNDEICTDTVQKYCPCGSAKCAQRLDDKYEGSICCEKGFDVVCCVGMLNKL
ncbi:hypothetical protein niasHS_012488 [Heterodera schachtii]|uniref:Uncharacterized protein n=1 Tax=Heterodera schachtii TaxID=97005 RepID=A0ABD2I8Z2_HETSC